MRVEVEREVASKMVKVWVIEDGHQEGRMRVWTPLSDPVYSEDRHGDWTLVSAGAEAPVSLRLPDDLWAAITAAGSDIPVPSRAQHDHLADAIGIRDRLLAIIEDRVMRPKTEPVVIDDRDGETGPWPGRADG